jgi:hypothetical protein
LAEIHHYVAEINQCKSIKRTELSPISGVRHSKRNLDHHENQIIRAAVLTSAMALGAGTSLGAQDQSMDKPSASVSGQVDQEPPAAQTAPQYNAPDQSAPQEVAPPSSQDQDAYRDRAYQDQAPARMARENPGLKGQDLAQEVDRQDSHGASFCLLILN